MAKKKTVEPKTEKDMKNWLGKFDPLKFDAKKATKAMQKGLPDWRDH